MLKKPISKTQAQKLIKKKKLVKHAYSLNFGLTVEKPPTY